MQGSGETTLAEEEHPHDESCEATPIGAECTGSDEGCASGAVWADVSTRLLRGLRALLEGLLEEERTAYVGAAPGTSVSTTAVATGTATTPVTW